MTWSYKLNFLSGKKLWLDPTNHRLLMCDHFGLRKIELDYHEIRTARFVEVDDTKKIVLNTRDPRHPSYSFEAIGMFSPFYYSFRNWRARLESQLDLPHAVTVNLEKR